MGKIYEKLMVHDDWGGPSSIAPKTKQVQSLAGNGKKILDNLLFVYAPKNTIRLKKGQFALGDGRLMLLSTKTEQVHLEKLA